MAAFTNQATLTYNGNTTTSNITVGEIVEVLSATKTPLVNTYTQDGRVTYTVSLINSGNTAFTDLTFSDNLGSYTSTTGDAVPLTYVTDSAKVYVNGVLATPVTITGTNPLTITGITVPANGNVLVVYETIANEFAPPVTDGTINNTASFTSPALTNPVTAQATVTADTAPVLSISKTLSPTSVTENGQITYTFIIQNRGNTATTVADNVVITDTFNPILNPIAVTINGSQADPADYQYNATTGLFQTNTGAITIPAATYTTNPDGSYAVTPGVTTVTVTGTI